jgi:cytochrome c
MPIQRLSCRFHRVAAVAVAVTAPTSRLRRCKSFIGLYLSVIRRAMSARPHWMNRQMPVPSRVAIRYLCLFWWSIAATGCGEKQPTMPVAGGDPQRGKASIERYGCVACHAIPGIPGHGSNVGPPLTKIARRAYVGGVLPNLPDEMVRWLRNPPEVDPRTAMPNLGISEMEAKDIAAYLYTLK